MKKELCHFPCTALDKKSKNHYTTNRKGADCKGSAFHPVSQKIDRLSWRLWRSIFFVIIVFLPVNLVHDLNGHERLPPRGKASDVKQKDAAHMVSCIFSVLDETGAYLVP